MGTCQIPVACCRTAETEQWEQKLREAPWWDVSDVVQAAPNYMQKDRAFLLAAVWKDGKVLKHASASSRADREIVLRAVENSGESLQWASPALRADRQVVRTALKTSADAFEFAAKHLKCDREFVLEAVQIKGRVLQYVDASLHSDPDVVIAAVTNAGFDAVKMHIDIDLFGDRDFVRILVHREGGALKFVDDCFQADKDVVLIAVRSTARAIKFATPELQSDKEIVMAAVENDGYFLQYVAKHLRADKDVVLAAVRNHPTVLRYALGGLTQDDECLIAAGKTLADKQFMAATPRSQNKKVILSLKFTDVDKNTDYANDFVWAMKEDEHFMQFDTYNPNAWEKDACHNHFPEFATTCRGTDDTCGFQVSKNRRSDGGPLQTCCWRFSFRYYADEAVSANGFMIQVQEREGLSPTQELETEMAGQARLKIFRTITDADSFHPELLEDLHAAIQSWYEAGCACPEAVTEIEHFSSKWHSVQQMIGGTPVVTPAMASVVEAVLASNNTVEIRSPHN
mmetsp:Transcript_62618/g.123765  ORF Transcript_62618/g.123765 Transcript_62618/m.123765 type:complete len:513 (+) Transcript_62618:55-1593(+)